MIRSSYATILTQRGVTSPADLNAADQEAFYKNGKPRRRRGHSTAAPTTHPKGGKVARKARTNLERRINGHTATLAGNKNNSAAAYKKPGSLNNG